MTAYSASLTDSLATLDSYSAVMPSWLSSMTEALTTDDTFSHQYTAVRPLIDQTGAASLGSLNSPLLLFTQPGYMDMETRAVANGRVSIEALNGGDSLTDHQYMVGIISESLTTSDANIVQQSLGRKLTDSIPYQGDSLSKHLFAARALKEQVGNDLLVSPMLLFPVPRNDVLTRIAGHVRPTAGETVHVSDTILRVPGFHRAPSDTTLHNETIIRALGLQRHPTESLTLTEALTRLLQIHRISLENIHTGEALARLIVTHRLSSDTLSTVDHYAGFSAKPRFTTDTLTTTDTMTMEQLLQAIMGYIWLANDGTVQADLPDWGWVLVEDPTLGNSMSVVPIPSATLDPTREK